MATRSFLAVLLFASNVFADVAFTSPSAGENVPAGTIKVEWEESGISPLISELTQYTLSLMVGGNQDGDMMALTTFVSQGTFSSGNTTQGTIPTGIASELKNGFFFRIISTRQEGGTVTDYSSRFSLTDLTGSTPLQYTQAVAALSGSTEGPAAIGNSPSTTEIGVGSTATSTVDGQSATVVTVQTSATPTDADATTATATLTSDPADSPAGLSAGAKAGVAAACIILTLVAIASCAACLLVRRRRAKQNVAEVAPQNPFLDHKVELSAENLTPPPRAFRRTLTQMSELSADSRVYELGDGARPPELDHMAFRAELDGSPVTESRPKPAAFI